MRYRNQILSICLLLASSFAVPSLAKESVVENHHPSISGPESQVYQGLLGDYLFIQNALAGDTTDGISARAESMRKASLKLGQSAELNKILPDLVRSAEELAKASGLEEARAAFGSLSDSMIAYRGLVAGGESLVAYCPMVKKSWLQDGKTISNPYYGSSMLRCGSIVADKN